jgi:hypothetical protein
MAAKRRSSQAPKTTGPRGPRGKPGPPGPSGPPGANHTKEIALLFAQMADVIRELQTQLTRIGQIQAQLDHLAMGEARPSAHRDPPRTDN